MVSDHRADSRIWISLYTIHEGLYKRKLYSRKPNTCVLLTPASQKCHLNWCRLHVYWKLELWIRVFFTDAFICFFGLFFEFVSDSWWFYDLQKESSKCALPCVWNILFSRFNTNLECKLCMQILHRSFVTWYFNFCHLLY